MSDDILDQVLISERAVDAWKQKVIELATCFRVLDPGTESACVAKNGELHIWVFALVELPDKDIMPALALLQMRIPADEWAWKVGQCTN